MTALPRFELISVADHGVLVDFPGGIDIAINRQVAALAAALRTGGPSGVGPLIPTYKSLLVHYDSAMLSQAAVREWILAQADQCNVDQFKGRRWSIPVCYGGEFGIDLEFIAQGQGMSEQEVITLHSACVYHVFMVGFAPGLAYLGPLPSRLHVSRRKTPRVSTPAGSVNIGGAQALIASVAGPSGWHLIGRTPARSFDPAREQPFLFEQGDEVCFWPITPVEYREYEALASRGAWLPCWEWVT